MVAAKVELPLDESLGPHYQFVEERSNAVTRCGPQAVACPASFINSRYQASSELSARREPASIRNCVISCRNPRRYCVGRFLHASGFRPKKRMHGRSSPYCAWDRAGEVFVDAGEGAACVCPREADRVWQSDVEEGRGFDGGGLLTAALRMADQKWIVGCSHQARCTNWPRSTSGLLKCYGRYLATRLTWSMVAADPERSRGPT